MSSVLLQVQNLNGTFKGYAVIIIYIIYREETKAESCNCTFRLHMLFLAHNEIIFHQVKLISD